MPQIDETNNLSVSDLLLLPSMAGSEVIAGKQFVGNIIAAPNVIEIVDLSNLSNENEAIFCPGLWNSIQTINIFEQLSRLETKKVSAICFKKGRLFKVSQAIMDLAEKIGLVLIELPVENVLTNIVREVSEEILQRKASAFRELQSKTETLLDILQNTQDLEESLAKMEITIGNPILLCTSEFEFIHSRKTQSLLSDGLKSELLMVMKQYGDGATDEQEVNCSGMKVFFLSISLTKQNRFSVFLLGEKKGIQTSDKQAISRIARILAVELRNSSETKKIQNQYRDQFIRDLLMKNSGNPLDLCMLGLSYGLNLNPDDHFSVVVVNLKSEFSDLDRDNFNIKVIRQMVSSFDHNSLIHTVADDRLVLIFRGRTLSNASIKQELQLFQKRIAPLLEGVKVFFCLSGEGNIASLPRLYQEACKVSLTYPILKPAVNILTKENSEPYYLLLSLKENSDAQQYCRKFIDPLRQFDEKFSANLVETLRIYLSNKSIKDTAEHMQLHYNTIAYRLGKIRTILGLDLKDALEIFILQLALYLEEINTSPTN
ncbi:MAG TPA: helix-turn-helix domain-containing protein [Anaerolineaceae bacterium]|nr:helix-turn-helix domain-containing protein [Anaerolineaceae bacterium]